MKIDFRLLALLFILFALLFRDPFSTRTLMGNFDPHPDSFHYLVSARSFLQGKGFVLEREGRSFPIAVPFLYPLSLVPILAMNNDPRAYYIANVFFMFCTVLLLNRLLKKLAIRAMVRLFVLFAFITNYYIGWYPQWAMAENILLPVILVGVSLLVEKPTLKVQVATGILPILLYSIKYANAPLTIAFYVLYLIKFFFVDKAFMKRSITSFVLSALISSLIFLSVDASISGGNFLSSIWSLVTQYASESSQKVQGAPQVSTEGKWFSIDYFPEHFVFYWNSLQGDSTIVLWEHSPLYPRFIAVLGLLGLCLSLLTKRRWFSLVLISLLGAQILFMSTFYSTDMRYVLFAIPFIYIGLGFVFEDAFLYAQKHHLFVQMILLFSIMCLVYGIQTFGYLRKQIVLNLKYAETPWWYISVQSTIDYINENESSFSKRPLVISAIPPYLFDFYSKKNFTLLPLSVDQEFRSHRKEVWGDHDYTNLSKVYESYLLDGFPVFVMSYGLGNQKNLIRDYKAIQQHFELQEVKPGCYTLCVISKLSLKKGAK